MNEKDNKKSIHLIWFYIILIVLTVFFSALFSLLKLQTVDYTVSSNLRTVSSISTVNSLFTRTGFRYIISEGINNLLSYFPLGTTIIGLIGIGFAIKSGFLKAIIEKINKILPRKVAFFVFSLLCIVMGFSSDLAFIIMIPASVVLFSEYKRSQLVGMTFAFVSVAAGSNINLFITSLDYSIIEIAKPAVKILDSNYSYVYNGNLFFIVVSTLLLALLLTIITELIIRTKPVRIVEEEQIDEKIKNKALKKSFVAFFILVIIFVYSIIPNLPFSGILLDDTQALYVNRLFGINSPFVEGILFIASFTLVICSTIYGLITKQIKNDKDIVKLFNGSLNGIGEMLVLLFFSAEFIALFKYTNIGNVISSLLFNVIKNGQFSFGILIGFSFLFVLISNMLLTSFASKWTLFVPGIMPLFMKSNMTPEFAGAVFRLASSASNIITPLFPYFAVYLGFIAIYSKNNFNFKNVYKLLLPYFISVTLLFLFIIFSWYILNIPIGPNIYPTI